MGKNCRFVLLSTFLFGLAASADELRVYSYLSPGYIGPALEAFEAETGIVVNVEYMRPGDILKRLVDERNEPGAEVVLTMEAKRLAALTAANVLAEVDSEKLKSAIPSQYRHPDGLWFGLSKWPRTVFYSTKRVDPTKLHTYHDLTKPEWKGRICARPSNKIYVQSLIASIIAHEGEQATRKWVRGMVANFARTPVDLDIKQIQDIAAGLCDITLANSYYYGRMMPLPFDVISGQVMRKKVLDEVGMHFVEHLGYGTHFNISGYARTRSEKNSENALAFMEYLASPSVQRLYADSSKDYPVISGLKPHLVLQQLGEYTEDKLPLSDLSQHYKLAERISKEEGWLWK